MIPLHDLNPRVWIRAPFVSWALLAACVLAWWPQVGMAPPQLAARFAAWGFVPADGLLTSLFLHAGAAHLLGNMLYLWVFADNVEDAMGHGRFLAFYLLCGVAATAGHWAFFPASETPLVGASGAISGVLGAYWVLYPRARILVPVIVFPLFVPAWLVIGLWFAGQAVASVGSVSGAGAAGGVAWLAHLFGFLAGAALVFAFRTRATPLFGGGRLPTGITIRRDESGRPSPLPRRADPE